MAWFNWPTTPIKHEHSHAHQHHYDQDLRIDEILRIVKTIASSIGDILADLTELRDEVAAVKGVADSAIALINNLSDRLDAIADDPEEIRALAAELRSKREELGAAVADNQPTA